MDVRDFGVGDCAGNRFGAEAEVGAERAKSSSGSSEGTGESSGGGTWSKAGRDDAGRSKTWRDNSGRR
jgi:hypothetical protein